MEPLSQTECPRVAVVGGGVAGLAAAVAAAEHGLRVELFESLHRLGGRAGSFREPKWGEWVDYCQHLSLGCCTNLADFCGRTGTADCFARQRCLHFIGPRGRRHDVAAARWLPAPLHLVPAFARLGYLSLSDRWRIGRTLCRLARLRSCPGEENISIGSWLRRQGESPVAIDRFWSVILTSALGEKLDRASVGAAGKVFRHGLLGSRRAYELELPQVPLDEIFNGRVAAWLAEHRVAVHLGSRIRALVGDSRRIRAVELSDGSLRPFDFIVVAMPWQKVTGLFPAPILDAVPVLKNVEQIAAAAITAVHLWFDRPITPLSNAVLVGRLGDWLFRRPASHPASNPSPPLGHYHQVVISASDDLVRCNRDEVIRRVLDELAAVWPVAHSAQLLHRRMVTQRSAVFSVRPGVERLRPSQATPIENLMLAGDWTDTGWPATMEGAVRSGYLAIEAMLRVLGRDGSLLAADLPQGRLARWLIGGDDRTRGKLEGK